VSPDATLELETDVDPGFGDRIPPPAWSAKLTAKLNFCKCFPPFVQEERCAKISTKENVRCLQIAHARIFVTVKIVVFCNKTGFCEVISKMVEQPF
jgi:hypothetical protein